jgi:hypothetical protein
MGDSCEIRDGLKLLNDGARCGLSILNWTASRYQIRKNVSRILLFLSDSHPAATILDSRAALRVFSD